MLALSLVPALRGWINGGQSHSLPVGIGEVIRASGVATLMASRHPISPRATLSAAYRAYLEVRVVFDNADR